MTLSIFALLTLYALSLRWLLFKYKRMSWFRWLLSLPKVPLLDELLKCVYCQTIESALLVYFCLSQRLDLDWGQLVFVVLTIGWIGILAEGFTEAAVAKAEAIAQIKLETNQQYNPPES